MADRSFMDMVSEYITYMGRWLTEPSETRSVSTLCGDIADRTFRNKVRNYVDYIEWRDG